MKGAFYIFAIVYLDASLRKVNKIIKLPNLKMEWFDSMFFLALEFRKVLCIKNTLQWCRCVGMPEAVT